MELLILTVVGLWLVLALRFCWRHRGSGCSGDCAHCKGCGKR